MKLQYLSHKEIDKAKWDNCIEHSRNSLIYCRSFYLDAMAEKWDALVSGDYEAVMPLIHRSKWGIKYLYEPAFIQQAGIYAKKKLSAKQVSIFVDGASGHFKFAETTLNYANDASALSPAARLSSRNNFVLDISGSYDKLYSNYLPGFTKSLRRIKKFDLQYHASGDYAAQLRLYYLLYEKRLRGLTKKDLSKFSGICKKLNRQGDTITRYVSNAKNEVLASVVLLKDGKRLYNIISCITPGGKKLEANYFLYDRVIHEFAGMEYLLDLEGSDMAGVAGFYKKFNPENQPYPFIKFNNLPAVVKLIKA